MDDQELVFQTKKLTKDVESLKFAVYGDNNSVKGLVRRVDAVERELSFIKKQNWVIIAMLFGLYAQFIASLIKP